MEKAIKRLRFIKLGMIGFPIVCVAEGYVLRSSPANASTGPGNMYPFQLTLVASILLIPVFIWWVNRKILRHELNENNYFLYALLRAIPPTFVLGVGVLYYLWLSDTSMLYGALVGLLFLFYVWPSKDRMEHELAKSRGKE